ncbi:MAG: hypothetical protein HOI66_19775, partial [Verrucomicrobia bacterium]|nr:hypothetical protein [Verrucomicrobiota bacterium]
MKQIVSARDVEAILQKGGSLSGLPGDAILTPSARDLVRANQGNGTASSGTESGLSAAVAEVSAGSVSASSSASDLEAFFNTSEMFELREQICEMGRRMWQRAYVDGNGGNIAIR